MADEPGRLVAHRSSNSASALSVDGIGPPLSRRTAQRRNKPQLRIDCCLLVPQAGDRRRLLWHRQVTIKGARAAQYRVVNDEESIKLFLMAPCISAE